MGGYSPGDGAVINLGNDQDVKLTHVAGKFNINCNKCHG